MEGLKILFYSFILREYLRKQAYKGLADGGCGVVNGE
jgi:hypothetical protein